MWLAVGRGGGENQTRIQSFSLSLFQSMLRARLRKTTSKNYWAENRELLCFSPHSLLKRHTLRFKSSPGKLLACPLALKAAQTDPLNWTIACHRMQSVHAWLRVWLGLQLMLLWPLQTSSKDKDFRLYISQFTASPQTLYNTSSKNTKTDTWCVCYPSFPSNFWAISEMEHGWNFPFTEMNHMSPQQRPLCLWKHKIEIKGAAFVWKIIITFKI